MFLYFRYKVNDLEDGNLLEISLRAEACFNDGGKCVVNIALLERALIPKWDKAWSSPYSVKGKYAVNKSTCIS
jgi:hypothetical protein